MPIFNKNKLILQIQSIAGSASLCWCEWTVLMRSIKYNIVSCYDWCDGGLLSYSLFTGILHRSEGGVNWDDTYDLMNIYHCLMFIL